MQTPADLVAFARLLAALEPWLDRIVVIGGWAHRLHRFHPSAGVPRYGPLLTLDTDIAMPVGLAANDREIRDRLRNAGFVEEFFGDDRPPATHYRLGKEESAFYAEFLCPLPGAEHNRKGKRVVTAQIGGVTAQRLRHIGLLLDDPWELDFALAGIDTGKMAVRVAHPVRFMAQKVLIHARRNPRSRAKDILYLHDTLELFGTRLAELRSDWLGSIATQLHPRHAAQVRKAAVSLFADVNDSIRLAAAMAAGRDVTAESLRESCQYGFEQIFG